MLINNREKMKESESFVLTLQKEKVNGDLAKKRINVKKIIPLDQLLNEPYSKVTIELKEDFKLNDIKEILSDNGNTSINLIINKKNQKALYSLENTRKFDLNDFKILKDKEYVLKIIV